MKDVACVAAAMVVTAVIMALLIATIVGVGRLVESLL